MELPLANYFDYKITTLIADQMEHILVVGRGAEQVGDKSRIRLIGQAVKQDSTVCELANSIDENYKFHGE